MSNIRTQLIRGALLFGALSSLHVVAGEHSSYIGIGSFQSEFLGSEYDRKYKSDTNEIRQISFGYSDKAYAEIFGDVNIDGDSEIRDFALGLVLEETIIKLERGKISGTIVDEDGPVIGEFDNDFFRLDILSKGVDVEGFLLGAGVQSYQVPHLFEFNDGSIAGKHIQDDKLSHKSVGIGIYYDPIYAYITGPELGFKSDWYFATSGLALSLSYVKASDAQELVDNGVNGDSWLLWGNSATYEMGWMWGLKTDDYGIVANVGYHLRANTFMNLNPAELFAVEADEGEIGLSAMQTFLHGLVAAVNVSF